MKFFILIFSTFLSASPLLLKQNTRPFQAESTLEALEPWETPIDGFFIRSHHEVPTVDPNHWVFTVDGLVNKPLKLTLNDLKKMETKSLHAVLECSGNGRGLQRPRAAGLQWQKGAVGNAEWSGIPLSHILKMAGVQENAKFATIEGADKPALPKVPAFIRSIPLSKIMEEDTLLATKMNRVTMPILHGGPLRLILPRWHGQNWIKWVTHITLTAEEDPGFFMKKGYRMPKVPLKPGEAWDSATGTPIGPLRVQSLIVQPRADTKVSTGTLLVKGKAFTGTGSIKSVELSVDEGTSWLAAKVSPMKPSGGWQEFEGEVQIKEEGPFTLLSKATDSLGNVQPIEQEWNPSGYLRNNIDKVTLTAIARDSKLLVEEKCLMCHTTEMLESQRLTSEQWDKVLTKMQGFGATFEPEERVVLLKYLNQFSPEEKDGERIATDFKTSEENVHDRPKGNNKNGKKLYASNCATCHGELAEGKTGPRLNGRVIPGVEFMETVLQGKRAMPSFSLSKANIQDLRAYLASF